MGTGQTLASKHNTAMVWTSFSTLDSQEDQDTRHSQFHLLYTHHMTHTDCKCLLGHDLR